MTTLPQRKHPIHLPTSYRFNRSQIQFVTVVAAQRRPILTEPRLYALMIDGWENPKNHWLVGRYLIMPDHLHFFCAPAHENTPLISWLTFWKSAVAKKSPLAGKLWQKNFWDTQIRTHEHIDEKWEYIRENPVHCGLVAKSDDWQWQGQIHQLQWDE